MNDIIYIFLFPSGIALAGAMDLLTYTIPNRVVLVLAIGFFACALTSGLPWLVLAMHVTVGYSALVIGYVLFTRGWVGGGDAKLMAAVALWFGFDHLLPFLFWTAMLGGTLALILLTYRSILPPLWLINQSWAMRLHDQKEGIPYGIAIAGAGLIVYPATGWMTGFAG